MSEWLRSLPHQIPFRSASTSELVDDRTARGTRLTSSGDALQGAPAEMMLVEAMAQVAGILAFGEAGQAGALAGIERFSMSRLPVEGDRIDIETVLETEFGGLFRFEGKAYVDDEQIATGTFYLGGGGSR